MMKYNRSHDYPFVYIVQVVDPQVTNNNLVWISLSGLNLSYTTHDWIV